MRKGSLSIVLLTILSGISSGQLFAAEGQTAPKEEAKKPEATAPALKEAVFNLPFTFHKPIPSLMQKYTMEDFSWIERTLKKEPEYKSKARYTLWVLGDDNKSVMPMAWDESNPGKGYDTLYLDLNYNGDLTEPSERIVFQPRPGYPTHKIFDIKGIKAKEGADTFNFKIVLDENSQTVYDTGYSRTAPYGDYGVSVLPSREPLRWSNDIKSAPVHRFGGQAVVLVWTGPKGDEFKQPGESLGKLEAGRMAAFGTTVAHVGDKIDNRINFGGSSVPVYGQSIAFLRVLDKDNVFKEDLPVTKGCACAGSASQSLLIPNHVPSGNHQFIVRLLRPEPMGGHLNCVYPVEVINPDDGKAIKDPAYAALNEKYPKAKFVSLRRAPGKLQGKKLFPEEVVVNTSVADNTVANTLPYGNRGGEAFINLTSAADFDGNPFINRGMVQFSLAPLPKNAKILGAKLRLALVAHDHQQVGEKTSIEAYAIRREWNEVPTGKDTTYCSWYGPKYWGSQAKPSPGVIFWEKGGCDDPEKDRFAEVAGTADISNFPIREKLGVEFTRAIEKNRLIEMDITEIAKKWQSGDTPNFGLLLKGTKDGKESFAMSPRAKSFNVEISSSENSDYPFRPTLVIAYEGDEIKPDLTSAEELQIKEAGAKKEKPILIGFTSALDETSVKAEMGIFGKKEVRQELEKRFNLFVFDAVACPDLAKKLGVRVIPSTLLLEPDGVTRKGLIAPEDHLDAKTFLEALNKIAARPVADREQAPPQTAVAVPPRPGEDLEQALQQAALAKRPLVMRFYLESCGICKKVEATTFKDDRVVKALGKMLVVKVDAERYPKKAAEFHVPGVPAIVVVAPDGKTVLSRIEAQDMMQPETLLPKLAVALPAARP
jgi:thioredoxin-like negative regulator of GroEL